MRWRICLAFLAILLIGTVGCGDGSQDNGDDRPAAEANADGNSETGADDNGETSAGDSGEAPGANERISQEEAEAIALKEVPGDVTEVGIEKKLGDNRYVIEVVPKDGGPETDVIIDLKTGEVLGLEQ